MNPQDTIDLAQQAIKTCLIIGGPILLVGVVIGLLVGILQAMTQIQDQTVSHVPKIIGIVLTISLLLPWTFDRLSDFAKASFQSPRLMITESSFKTSKKTLNGSSAPTVRVGMLPVTTMPRTSMPQMKSRGSMPRLMPRPEFNFEDSPSPGTNQPFRLPVAPKIQTPRGADLNG